MAYRWSTSLKTETKIKEASQTERKKSPNVMTKTWHQTREPDAIAQANEEYAAISTSDLRLTIRRTKPTVKPSVDLTTSTVFGIIEIKSKVHK